MSTGLLSPDPRLRELTDLGLIAGGALLHTYVSGSTSTPLATFSDVALTIPNANPIVASAGGLFGPIYLTVGLAYKYVLTDALGNELWRQDPIRLDATVAVTEANLTLSDVTTDDVSIAAHGFAPKAPNDATKFLNGLGAYAVPAAGVIPAGVTLIHQGTVTDASAGAATVDAFAVTMTAKDRLFVTYTLESTTQATAGPITLFSTTDAALLTTLFSAGAGITAGQLREGIMLLSPGITDLHQVQGLGVNIVSGTGTMELFASAIQTMATLLTTALSFGVRHGGVTAGGTFKLTWSVYKLAGQ